MFTAPRTPAHPRMSRGIFSGNRPDLVCAPASIALSHDNASASSIIAVAAAGSVAASVVVRLP